MVETSVKIEAPPELVRSIVLDFQNIPQWHHKDPFIKFIEHIPQSVSLAKYPRPPKRGDTLECEIGGLSFTPTVLENSETCLQWRGHIPFWGILTGVHSMRFEPNGEEGTLFKHQEEFTGALWWLMYPAGPFGESAKKGFERFNRDLKIRCEEVKRKRGAGWMRGDFTPGFI